MFGQRLVGKHAGRANLHQVAGKLAFEHAGFSAAEEHPVARAESGEVGAPGIVLVITHAAVTGDAAVHFMADKRPEVLIFEGGLQSAVAAVAVAHHNRHILKMAFAPFLTHRAVVGMIEHQVFDDGIAKQRRVFRVKGETRALGDRRHTGHDQAPAGVLCAGVLDYRALPAGAHAAHGRVPAEVRHVDMLRQHGLQQVDIGRRLVGHAVNVVSRHQFASR